MDLETKVLKRPQGLTRAILNTEFKKTFYQFVEVDLDHINKFGRTHYTAADVSFILKNLLKEKKIEVQSQRIYTSHITCTYYCAYGDYERIDKKTRSDRKNSRNNIKDKQPKGLKLIFCICSDKPDTIGVITLYRIKSSRRKKI